MPRWIAPTVTAIALLGCTSTSPDYFAPPPPPGFDWQLPPGFPLPSVPTDNPMSVAKVQLGRYLFYDKRLSGNQSFSCATCHRQELAFTDGRSQAIGSTGETHIRNTMSLINVAYSNTLHWADPSLKRLEDQALIPMINTEPVELGLAERLDSMVARLRQDHAYRQRFASAFPTETDPINLDNVLKAIAAFERTLISSNSPYDRLNYLDDRAGMSASAWRGMALFFSQRIGCSACHRGHNFSGTAQIRGGPKVDEVFVNTGLYNVDGRGAYPETDIGLQNKSGRRRDMGKFKIPTLRNIAVTGPYMHDGSIAELSAVIEHYATGGRAPDWPNQRNRYKDDELKRFTLSPQEQLDLLAFLHALTDPAFLTDPRFSDPFASAMQSD